MSEWEKAKHGLGDYLNQLARAKQVQRLLERYLALAPVFIGGPGPVPIDLGHHTSGPTRSSSPTSEPPLTPLTLSALMRPSVQPPIGAQLDVLSGQNGLTNISQIGALTQLLQQPSMAGGPISPSTMASINSFRNMPGYPQGSNETPAGGHPYQSLFERMRAAQSAAAAAAALATAQQQEHHQRRHILQQQLSTERRPSNNTATGSSSNNNSNSSGNNSNNSRPSKRRRTSAGNGKGSVSHLSGEMIRKLREQQKMRSAAAGASAGQTSGRTSSQRHRNDSARSVSSVSSITTTTSTSAAKPTPITAPIAAPSTSTSSAATHRPSSALTTQPPPLMSTREDSFTEIIDVRLNDQIIPAFSIGGEPRLCLPQILRQILGPFHWEQICLACEELQIHIAPCSTNQLIALKTRQVLPLAAHQCGLITKSDAERLISYLSLAYQRTINLVKVDEENGDEDDDDDGHTSAVKNEDLDNDDNDVRHIDVVHKCFGRARGRLYPGLYVAPHSECIRCKECHKLLEPSDFVRHLHKDRENRTCHWGFDPSHWRYYVHVDDEFYDVNLKPEMIKPEGDSMSSEAAKDLLNSVKGRFPFRPYIKRRRQNSATIVDGVKRPKVEIEQDVKNKPDLSTKFDVPKLQPNISSTHGPHHLLSTLTKSSKFRPWSGGQRLNFENEQLIQIANLRRTQASLSSSSSSVINGTNAGSPRSSGWNETREDPTQYIDDVKQILLEEKGLSPQSREMICGIVSSLVERLIHVENANDSFAQEIVALQERIQNVESEKSKKDDEMRQFFLMQQQSAAGQHSNNNLEQRRVAYVNGRADATASEASTSGLGQQPLAGENVLSFKRLVGLPSVASVATNNNNNSSSSRSSRRNSSNSSISSSNHSNNVHPSNSRCASPLNLSLEVENSSCDDSKGSSLEHQNLQGLEKSPKNQKVERLNSVENSLPEESPSSLDLSCSDHLRRTLLQSHAQRQNGDTPAAVDVADRVGGHDRDVESDGDKDC